MNLKLASASLAAALALGVVSIATKAAPIGAGLTSFKQSSALVLKAHDDDDRGRWWWRHHRFDNDDRDSDRDWWRRHHRIDRNDDRRHASRDHDERNDRDDRRWR